MKVLINTTYTDLAFSAPVMFRIIKERPDLIYTYGPENEYIESEKRGSVEDQLEKELSDDFYYIPLGDGWYQSRWRGTLVKDKTFYSLEVTDEQRTDPFLISLFEKFGDSANVCDFKLKIVEIPDDVVWAIGKPDVGGEWVYEKHRTWS